MIRVRLSRDEAVKLKGFRIEANLLQKSVGEAVGCSDKSIGNYEVGRLDIPLEILEKLAELYGKEEIKNFGIKFEVKNKNHGCTPSSTSHANKEERKKKMLEIMNTPEVYDFSKMPKLLRTKQTDELNFYIPEKWKR